MCKSDLLSRAGTFTL